jgi:hypothetical protein
MRLTIVLIEGDSVAADDLRISLSNAKQIVLGRAWGFGHIVHIAAETSPDLEAALRAFAAVPNVEGVVTLATRLTD